MMALYFIAIKSRNIPNFGNGYHCITDIKDIVEKEEEIKISIEQTFTQGSNDSPTSPLGISPQLRNSQCSKSFSKTKALGTHFPPIVSKSKSGRLSDSKIYSETPKKPGLKNLHTNNSQSPVKPNLPKPVKTKADSRLKNGNSPPVLNHRSTPTNLDSHQSITPSHLTGILKMKKCGFK